MSQGYQEDGVESTYDTFKAGQGLLYDQRSWKSSGWEVLLWWKGLLVEMGWVSTLLFLNTVLP
jgi:hypothetical protein